MNSNPPASYLQITEQEFSELAALDSCSVANAIERFGVQLRNEGYTEGEITCRFPHMPSMLGYAFSLQVRSSAPPSKGKVFFEDSHWWDSFLEVPRPRLLIIQDMDRHPGVGALVGEVQAEILASLGCIGIVTNGAVSDLPRLKPLHFHVYSSTLSVSHSYSHIVHTGGRVQIGGLEINTGDLLHGDCHGIVRVPKELANRIPATVRNLRQKEAEIISYSRSSAFSVEGLRSLLAKE